MVFFNGSMKLTVVEAEDLRPTDFATRHQVGIIAKTQQTMIDPFCAIDVDEIPVARTLTKPKTFKPVWNEDFSTEVHSGQNIGLTIFHDAAIPPDEFVANCNIAFEDIADKQLSDIWVRIMIFDTQLLAALNYLWSSHCNGSVIRVLCFRCRFEM